MDMTRRVLALFVLVGIGAATLSGCAAGLGGSSSESAAQAPPQNVTGEAAAGEVDTAVVITGRISIVTDDPIAAAAEATDIVTDAGGHVSARTERAAEAGSDASAERTLRIPADALEDVRAGLAELGSVQDTLMESVEVTGVQRDLDARITTLRTSIARYNEWLGAASETADLIELESAIADRQTELEGLESQARSLADQVDMTTVTLALHSAYVPITTAPQDLGGALALGWSGFLAFWASVGLSLAVASPWLILLALIAVGAIWLIRRASAARAARPQPPRQTLDGTLFPEPVEAAREDAAAGR